MYTPHFLFLVCVLTSLPVVVAVGAGAPPHGHVPGARLEPAGCPAAHEEEPGDPPQLLSSFISLSRLHISLLFISLSFSLSSSSLSPLHLSLLLSLLFISLSSSYLYPSLSPPLHPPPLFPSSSPVLPPSHRKVPLRASSSSLICAAPSPLPASLLIIALSHPIGLPLTSAPPSPRITRGQTGW